ncbi:hypothetical protein OH818_23105 [Jiella pelagia]|uniref:Uncharacterized protein n=1 Tax=Jiella pelagia TaxID=2986949 RepID=A0ABY7BYM1_9HYPH|nr:hypothetical protein [Jiella pelagia]WAP68220.1 hypothetical protein OH818_23105 [Jiella pelagia]
MPRTIAGGAVTAYQPGTFSPMPCHMSTWPLSPKSSQGLPVSASTAINLASSVASMMRAAQAWPSDASGTS